MSEAGAAARRSYPSLRSGAASQNARRRRRSKGRESLRHVGGQGRRLRGATPRPRPGAAAARSFPMSEAGVAAGRSYPASEARGGGREELPRVRGQGRRPGGATPA